MQHPYLWGFGLIVAAVVILLVVGPLRPWQEMKPAIDATTSGTWKDLSSSEIMARAGQFGLWSLAYVFPALFIILGLRCIILKR